MAYMRGSFYLWQDDVTIHLWSRNGYDGWDQSVWNETVDSTVAEANRASGVAIPPGVADEFVVMRIAQLIDEGKLSEAIDRAIHKWGGNGGCRMLIHLKDRIKRAGIRRIRRPLTEKGKPS